MRLQIPQASYTDLQTIHSGYCRDRMMFKCLVSKECNVTLATEGVLQRNGSQACRLCVYRCFVHCLSSAFSTFSLTLLEVDRTPSQIMLAHVLYLIYVLLLSDWMPILRCSISIKHHDLNCTECSFFIKVIGREGFEELNPRMWKNIQEYQKAFENVFRAERKQGGGSRTEEISDRRHARVIARKA